MKRMKLGSLDCVVAGGTDREGGGEGPVVVLLHGFGAGGDDLVGLWRALEVPAATRFVFPAAPLVLAKNFMFEQRAWWMIDMAALEAAMASGSHRDMAKDVPEGLAAAREAVEGMLDAVQETLRSPPGRLVLGGFSQGAMLSLDVALRSDRKLAGLALMSGTLLCEDEWKALMPARAGLAVMQSHGTVDPILPFAAAEALRDLLSAAGLDVAFVPFRGAHEIPGPALAALGALINAA